MKIYFVRHGITHANLERKYNGIIDEPLAKEGKEDLSKKIAVYKDIDFDYVYCSPLIRVKESFEILFPELSVDEYRDDLVEMDFGDWAGLSYDEKFKELAAQGYTWDDIVDPPNGESYDDLFERTTNFLEEVIENHNGKNNVLVMCHGIVISAIMKKHFLQEENIYGLSPENGLGYVIDTETKEVVVIEHK